MPRSKSEDEDDAPPSPSMTTPTKTSHNSWADHGEPESEETDTDEEEFVKGQKKSLRNYTSWLEYVEQETWVTWPEAIFEKADIDYNQILQLMTKFMTDSRLFKTPGHKIKRHKSKKTDFHLWKLSSKEYYSKRSDENIRIHKCPLAHRCDCKAKCRVSVGKNYVRLEFHGMHDETSHATERSKESKYETLKYKQIIAIHNAVIIAPNQSATKLLRNFQNAS
jgi:hypothetical protein